VIDAVDFIANYQTSQGLNDNIMSNNENLLPWVILGELIEDWFTPFSDIAVRLSRTTWT
jgi:hypothetical protein